MKNGLKSFCFYLIIPAFFALIFTDFVKNHLVLANLVFYSILLTFFFFISRHELKEHLLDLKNNFKKYFWTILKWVLIGFILMMLSNYIIGLFIDGIPNNELGNREFLLQTPIYALLYLLIIAPSLEEYVFRYSFGKIKNYYLFTIFTGLLFASLHLLSITKLIHIWYVIPYFFISFGFANIYFKCQNYFASTIGHIIHNVLCVIIVLVF